MPSSTGGMPLGNSIIPATICKTWDCTSKSACGPFKLRLLLGLMRRNFLKTNLGKQCRPLLAQRGVVWIGLNLFRYGFHRIIPDSLFGVDERRALGRCSREF